MGYRMGSLCHIVLCPSLDGDTFMNDPVHKEKDGWYFWDETWADRIGPYTTEEEAREQLEKYCGEFLGL